MLPPGLDDFEPGDSLRSRQFLLYASICQLLGDIVESCLRPQQQPTHNVKTLENALYRWVKQDFRSVDSSSHLQYSLETRHILVTYFANLIILDRTPTSDGIPSVRSLVASSFLSGIYKEFLIRDEICYLGPAFAFYALCAGLALIPTLRFPALRATAVEEFQTLIESLRALSKHWGSAFGALRALQRLGGEISQQSMREDEVPVLSDEMVPFFEDFNKSLCLQWNAFSRTTEFPLLDIPTPAVPVPEVPLGPEPVVEEFPGLDLLNGNWEGAGFDWSGSWLLEDRKSVV